MIVSYEFCIVAPILFLEYLYYPMMSCPYPSRSSRPAAVVSGAGSAANDSLSATSPYEHNGLSDKSTLNECFPHVSNAMAHYIGV